MFGQLYAIIKKVTTIFPFGETVVAEDGAPKSRWDEFFDRIRRIPRILMIFMVIAWFWWSYSWSGGDFLKWAQAMKEVPEPVWFLITTIVLILWGVTKITEDYAKIKTKYGPMAVDAAEEANESMAPPKTERGE